jgi:hypothetical protein
MGRRLRWRSQDASPRFETCLQEWTPPLVKQRKQRPVLPARISERADTLAKWRECLLLYLAEVAEARWHLSAQWPRDEGPPLEVTQEELRGLADAWARGGRRLQTGTTGWPRRCARAAPTMP